MATKTLEETARTLVAHAGEYSGELERSAR